ncbi:DUF6126 family protein [Streptomyces celluloflavus]|uniref:DUF6126 family protein n=1 Tax=Streptomyces celluloflavus TaxID=58344 RepID=UPI0036A40E09
MSDDDVADKTAPGSSTPEEKRKERGVSWRVFIYIAGSHAEAAGARAARSPGASGTAGDGARAARRLRGGGGGRARPRRPGCLWWWCCLHHAPWALCSRSATGWPSATCCQRVPTSSVQ